MERASLRSQKSDVRSWVQVDFRTVQKCLLIFRERWPALAIFFLPPDMVDFLKKQNQKD